MISKAQVKYIKSLARTKIRRQEKCFIAEGNKVFNEFQLSSYKIRQIYALRAWIEKYRNDQDSLNVLEVDEKTMKEISHLSTATDVLCVIENDNSRFTMPENGLIPVFWEIQDPGNLGTLIRTALWFGLKNILIGEGSADLYNPKVIQASMGAVAHAHIHYVNYKELEDLGKDKEWVATTMQGKPVGKFAWPKASLLFMGNEGSGLPTELLQRTNHQISIPGSGDFESLNVHVAGALCMGDYFMRQ